MILIGPGSPYDPCPAYAAQYVAISPDVHILGPTSIPTVSYEIPGMDSSVPMPEWRVKSTTSWHELWQGLMSNETAMQQMKVLHIFKPPLQLCIPCLPWMPGKKTGFEMHHAFSRKMSLLAVCMFQPVTARLNLPHMAMPSGLLEGLLLLRARCTACRNCFGCDADGPAYEVQGHLMYRLQLE